MVTDTKTCEIVPKTISIYISAFAVIEAKKEHLQVLELENWLVLE